MRNSSARVTRWLSAVALAGLAGSTIAAGSSGSGVGVDRRASVYSTSTQEAAALAPTADGGVVSVWESRRQEGGTYGVFARRFDAFGVPVTSEIHVNSTTASMQRSPTVATAPDGSVWFAWTSFGQDGSAGTIVARRFTSDLEPAGDEFIVNQTRAGEQVAPSIAIGSDGHVLMTWTSDHENGTVVIGRGYDAAGIPMGGEFRVGNGGFGLRESVSTVSSVGTGFVVTWARADAGTGEIAGILVQRFDSTWRPIGDELEVAAGGVEPSLGASSDGFAVTWLAPAGDGFGVLARWFDADGVAMTDPVTIASHEAGFHSGTAAAWTRDGRTVIAFNRDGGSGPDVLAGVYERGQVIEPPAAFTSRREGAQSLAIGSSAPRIAVTSSGSIAVAWAGDAGLGDSTAAHVSLRTPVGQSCLAMSPAIEPSLEVASRPELTQAEPIEPPVFDPDTALPRLPIALEGDGIDFAFPAIQSTGWTPPDPEMAVGPNHVVCVVNVSIAWYTKDGTQQFLAPLDSSGNPGFFETIGGTGFIFDAEAMWDPFSNRYWVMANERGNNNRAYFDVAVSDDDDPNGTWHKYRIDVTTAAGASDIDSPNFAIGPDAVYLTADFFTPSDKFLVFMVDKAPMLSGNPITTQKSLLLTGRQSFGVPQSYDAGALQYMLESTEQTTNTTVVFHAIRNPLGTPTRVEQSITVPTYRYPGQPNQKGSASRFFLFEPRFWSCVQRNGSLWAVHHIRNPGNETTLVRWYEFDLNGWPDSGNLPTIAQWGELPPPSGSHTYFPSVNVDDEGNAAITFARSGTNEYASMWRVLRRWSDAAGTFGPQTIVKESFSPHNQTRWGDYSKTQADEFRPCHFWGYHEYVNTGGSWGTFVGEYLNFCPADLNQDCVSNVFDFLAFQTAFSNEDPIADMDGNGVFNVFDFLAFQTASSSC